MVYFRLLVSVNNAASNMNVQISEFLLFILFGIFSEEESLDNMVILCLIFWGTLTTARLHFHFSLSCIGEGNGNPLHCFCLENPRDGGAWWAAIYGVAQSRTRLKRLSSSSPHKRPLKPESLYQNSPTDTAPSVRSNVALKQQIHLKPELWEASQHSMVTKTHDVCQERKDLEQQQGPEEK